MSTPFAGFLWNLTNWGTGIVSYGAGKDFQRNPGKARHLLDMAGWRDPDGKGSLPCFTLTFNTSTEESSRQVAEIT